MVLRGEAPERLLDTYDEERRYGADENILNSTRATDFLTPKTDVSKTFRDAVLTLAAKHPFARPLVNSGRLSVPCVYDDMPLNGPNALDGPTRSRVGAPCPDAPLAEGFLLDLLTGGFVLMGLNTDLPEIGEVDGVPITPLSLHTETDDPTGALAARYLGDAPAGVYLIRPDQHVTARWPLATADDVRAALRRAIGKEEG
jgi:3-(3-hydroxy-phenyl)propionate hydroxylase